MRCLSAQSLHVGDVLSGTATQTGVDLVLYYGDVGMKHVFVRGDEGGLSFSLTHVSAAIPIPIYHLYFRFTGKL
jgi:hypothetical protein